MKVKTKTVKQTKKKRTVGEFKTPLQIWNGIGRGKSGLVSTKHQIMMCIMVGGKCTSYHSGLKTLQCLHVRDGFEEELEVAYEISQSQENEKNLGGKRILEQRMNRGVSTNVAGGENTQTGAPSTSGRRLGRTLSEVSKASSRSNDGKKRRGTSSKDEREDKKERRSPKLKVVTPEMQAKREQKRSGSTRLSPLM